MDPTAIEGVGVADYGAEEEPVEEGTPGTTNQEHDLVPDQTLTPTPRRTSTTGPPPLQQPAAPTSPTVSAVQHAVPPTPVASDPLPVNPTEPEAEAEEESVLLDLTPVSPSPLSQDGSVFLGDDDVVQSPHTYEIPDPHEDIQDNVPTPKDSGFEILQSIVQRLTALETAHGQPSANDTLIGEALLKLAKSSITQTAALQGVQRLLIRSDKARKAEARRSEAALGILSQAVDALTEELRLSSGKIATAIAEQTLALRQKLASAATQDDAGASTSSSPTHSSDPPSACISPPPQRGIRRQRGGRRGKQ